MFLRPHILVGSQVSGMSKDKGMSVWPDILIDGHGSVERNLYLSLEHGPLGV